MSLEVHASRGKLQRLLDLRFPDAALEKEFWQRQDTATWEQVRIASWMGIGLFGFFGLLADQVITRGFVADDILRYGVAMPCILLGIVLSYFRRFDRWRSLYISFSILVSGAVSNAALAVTDLPTDWAHSANMLVVGFNFTFIALRFRNAMLNGLLLSLHREGQWPGSHTRKALGPLTGTGNASADRT